MNLVHNDSSQPVPPPYSPSIENLEEHRHQSPTNNISQQTSEPTTSSNDLTDSSVSKRTESRLISVLIMIMIKDELKWRSCNMS